MNIRPGLLAVTAFFLAAQLPAANKTQQPSPLVGTWTLVAADVLRPDGTRARDYGDDPRGVLFIDASGRYSLQIFDSSRPRFASNDRAKGTAEEYRAAVMGSSTHFGTIAVDLVLQQKIFDRDWVGLILAFMGCAVVIAITQALICALMKWLLMGVYKPVMKPMWSFWAMRTEAIAVLYWGLGGKVLFDYLRGTPFLPWFLRLFGAQYGQGVWLDSTDITEFDCIKVGDFCTVNAHSALQTHLYEDRVMKVGRVTLGKGVCVGAGATVLYDTHVGDYAQIGLLTVIMKGENLPANTRWEGAPAVPAAGH